MAVSLLVAVDVVCCRDHLIVPWVRGVLVSSIGAVRVCGKEFLGTRWSVLAGCLGFLCLFVG